MAAISSEAENSCQDLNQSFEEIAETRQNEESLQGTRGLLRREIVLALAAIGSWFALIAGGTLIGTQKWVDGIANGSPSLINAWRTVLVFAFSTITNIGFLAIIAAIIGAFAYRVQFSCNRRIVDDDDLIENPKLFYWAAILRGFSVYIVVLAGLLVVATDALLNPTQGQYVRTAGLVSAISLYAGYDAAVVVGLLDRIKQFITPQSHPSRSTDFQQTQSQTTPTQPR